MAKEMCECCGEREATDTLCGDQYWSRGLEGAMVSWRCCPIKGSEIPAWADRIRARRAKAEQPSDTIPAPPVKWAESVHPDAEPYVLPPQKWCRECSRPERPIAATHGELCVYCANWDSGVIPNEFDARRGTDAMQANIAARARMAAADRKAQPRATAESRMLALPHPWEMQDD